MRKLPLLALALTLAACQDVTRPDAALAPAAPAADQVPVPVTHPLTVQISGPQEITAEGVYEYEALPEGGPTHIGQGYYYQWYVRWDRDGGYERPLGTARTQQVGIIAAEGNFRLRVEVWRGGSFAQAFHYVTNLMTCGQDYCPVSGG